MGCFLACFGFSKDRKHQKQRNEVLPLDQQIYGSQKSVQQTVSLEQNIPEKSTNSILELQDRSEEQLSLSNRKKVTFDSNVRTYEHVSVHNSTDILPKIDKGIKKEGDSFAESSLSHSLAENGSVTSSIGSYPQNHRYQNCRDNDDTVEESEDKDSDLDDEEDEKEDYGDYDEDGDYRISSNEVWSETIPTTSMKSRTDISPATVVMEEVESPVKLSGLPQQEVKTIGLGRNARDRSVYVDSVLNPVENLSQWKAVKSEGTPSLKSDKENCIADREAPRILFSSEWSFKESSFSFKSNFEQSENINREIAVDASLSNWLVSSATSPTKKTSSIGLETIAPEKSMSQGSNSVTSIDDKPILGALTVEEVKQFSASCSPRRSPSQSPEEMPIIGTVGTYWNHTSTAKDSGSASSYKGIPNTTSKYREDKRVNWHSTPFETRLERALNRGVSKA